MRILPNWFMLYSGVLSLMFTLYGCSTSKENYDNEYRDSPSLPSLEIPPDLTQPGWDRQMEIEERSIEDNIASPEAPNNLSEKQVVNLEPEATTSVLPQFSDIRVLRDGNVRWLETKISSDILWARLRAFWKEQGIELQKDEPQSGVMETEWYDHENGLPRSGLQGAVNQVVRFIKDSGLRDRYRVRLEKVSDEVTNVYISLKQAQKVGDQDDDSTLHWELRPADPDIEAEMLTKFMVTLGSSEDQARHALASTQSAKPTHMEHKRVEGVPTLIVDDEFSVVWRRLGIALDRAGLYVEQQDRAKGIYDFTYGVGDEDDRKGFWARLFSGGDGLEEDGRYEVHMLDRDGKTLVTVHNDSGDKEGDNEEKNKTLQPESAEMILKRIEKTYQSTETKS